MRARVVPALPSQVIAGAGDRAGRCGGSCTATTSCACRLGSCLPPPGPVKTIEMDPAPAQPGQLTEPQARSKKGQDVIPPEQGSAAEQPAGFFGSVGVPLDLPSSWSGSARRLGGGTLRTGLLWGRPRSRRTAGCDAGWSGRPAGTRGSPWRQVLMSGSCRSARSSRDEGTTTTGQTACSTAAWLTDPSSSSEKPPRPRDPTTSRSASTDSLTSASAGCRSSTISAAPRPH